jgi:gliding motility-associated-like protein
MTNRLHKKTPALPVPLVVCLFILTSLGLQAQPGFFNFNYTGPTTFNVGAADNDCSMSVAEANPIPTVTSTIPGANIITSQFDPAASGYQFTDQWPAPTLNLIVHWFVQDDQGHSATFTFVINFVDLTPPTFDNLPPATASYGSIVQVPPPPNVTVMDNCLPGNPTLNYSQTTPPDTCDAGVFTRTWSATDIAGNMAVFTQTITIFADVQPPVISGFPQNGSAPCAQLGTAYPAWLAQQMANFNAFDLSGVKSYTNNAPPTFPDGCVAPLTVIFKATDYCNLNNTVTAIFTTSDNTPPVVTVEPKDTVAYCSPTNGHITALNDWISNHAYLVASDACMSDSFLVVTMQVDGAPQDSAGVVAEFLASYADGCGTKLVGSQTYNKVRGLVRVDFFVRDACGNSTFAGQAMFGAIDTLPPVITGSNAAEQCGGANDQANVQTWINAHGNATVTDECSSTTWTNFSYSTSDGQSGNGVFNSGPYPQVQSFNCNWYVDVTFRATDDCGNTGSATFRFQIQDTQPPVISALPPDTLSCPNPVPTLASSFITDNCDTSTVVTYTFTTSDTICPGSYTMNVIWRATDDCGNSSTATQTILVRDTEGPVFTLVPPADTFRCDTFVLPPFPVMGVDITATDNCSQAMSITSQDVSQQDPNPAVCGHYTYNIIRTFTATDACGNTSTATQIISVIDNLGPEPGGLLDTTIVCEAMPFVTPPPSPVDACSGPTAPPVFLNDIVGSGPCDDSYPLTRNWSAQDVCGNTSIIPQNINVVDTVKPVLTNIPADVTVECDAIPDAPLTSSFNPDDNCDESVTVTLNESEIRNPDTTACDHWANYIIRREWTATDNCGNASTYTQHISVQDNTGPVIVPVPLVSLPAELGLCGATVGIPAPISLFDECTSLSSGILLMDTSLLVNTSGGPNNTTPVDTVVFQWSSPNMPPGTPALDPIQLTIFVETADAEGPSEYFRIYGENNFLVGQTVLAPAQCGSSTTNLLIPAAEFNSWLTDGQLTLTLAPNGTGSEAINALATCAGGRVRAELAYQVANQQVPITLMYSLDGDTAAMYPPSSGFFLDVGQHTVVYTAIDCAGNSTTATTTIEVQDLQPPMLTPPAPDTFYVEQTSCLAVVTLPFPTISDNCDLSGHLVQASASLPVIFENDPNAGWIPKDITLSFAGLIPNAISNGLLGIRHKGDNDNAMGGEFFRVFDENNNFLSATTSGTTAGQCSLFHESVINVTKDDINLWAAGDFTTFFKLEANDDAGSFADFIDTCGTRLPDMTDGVSRVQAVLEYSYAVVTYEIRNSNNELVGFGPLVGNQTTDTLPPGNYTVKYLTTDINGLEGTTNFSITVLDTVKPQAICESLTIQVNPSGLPGDTYILQASEVDNGSFDNCSGTNLTFQLSQTNFSCAQAGSNFNVTLTVTDGSGNSSTCSAIVSVITTVIQPTYDPVCEGGTLQLYANPPTTASSYNWSGPNFFSSNLQNPTLPALLQNQGTYCVTVTGLTGCTATGCITVDLATLPTQPVISANKVSFCAGDNIVLATPAYPAQDVTYQWFQDLTPNPPVSLGITDLPIFTINTPPVGTYRYFVKVTVDSCASSNSNLLTVNVYAIPTASVLNDTLSVCECAPISLGTNVQGPGIKYMWTGPLSFMDTINQFPLVTNCATQNREGNYTLIIKQNGCSSSPAHTYVDVREKPATPEITGATKVCEGSNVTLICTNEPNAFAYEWLSPTLDTVTTSINSLVLTGVMVSDSGSWRVRIRKENCYSDWSLPILVEVERYPNVTGSSNGPVCQGAPLQLSATSNDAITSWTWYGPPADSWVVFQQNPTRNPAVAGTYKVIGKTSFGCADTFSVNVVVVTPPVISSVTNTAPICCDGSNAVLQAVVISNNLPLTYIWKDPHGQFTDTIIPNVCFADNGTYTLVVYDKFGCSSAVGSTVIDVDSLPARPTVTVNPPAVCVGADVTISISNSNQYSNHTFNWHTPTGDTTTAQSFIIIENAQIQDAGNYFALATAAINGCVSDSSNPAPLVVSPIPQVPVITANSPLCEGSTLQLNTQFIPNAMYEWMGPGGFAATTHNPSVPNVDMGDEGIYRVRIKINGCWSPLGEGVFVDVIKRPQTPELVSNSPVCLAPAGMGLNLQVAGSSQVAGAQYTWYYIPTTVLAGPSFAISYQTSDFSNFSVGPNQFYAVASKDGCNSLASAPITVQFDIVPNVTPFAGVDTAACASAPVQLAAANPAPAAGLWTQVSNYPGTFSSAGNPNSLLNNVIPGVTYTLAWTLSNGGCKNFASDTLNIETFAPEQALVKDSSIVICYTDSVQLHAIQGQTIDGYWTQLGQNGLGVKLRDENDPDTWATGLTPSNIYYFDWNLDNGACGISKKQVKVVNYGAKSNAGADQLLCSNDSCTNLTGSQVNMAFETGLWYSPDPSLEFSNATNHATTVCNLKRGTNTIIWMTNGGFCGPESYDTVLVVYDLQPTAVPDTLKVDFGTKIDFEVLPNDIVPQQFSITVEQEPSFGNFEDLGNGSFAYQPFVTFSGPDQMVYKICNLVCPTPACSTATVVLNVGKVSDCPIFNVITPNGDDVNDFFFVPCLDGGEGHDNEVTIFNQWGDVVFHAKPYNNNDPWRGQYNGQDLPVGTYFYVVKLDGDPNPRTGFLQLQR